MPQYRRYRRSNKYRLNYIIKRLTKMIVLHLYNKIPPDSSITKVREIVRDEYGVIVKMMVDVYYDTPVDKIDLTFTI